MKDHCTPTWHSYLKGSDHWHSPPPLSQNGKDAAVVNIRKGRGRCMKGLDHCPCPWIAPFLVRGVTNYTRCESPQHFFLVGRAPSFAAEQPIDHLARQNPTAQVRLLFLLATCRTSSSFPPRFLFSRHRRPSSSAFASLLLCFSTSQLFPSTRQPASTTQSATMPSVPPVYIVSAVRTPVGSFLGCAAFLPSPSSALGFSVPLVLTGASV